MIWPEAALSDYLIAIGFVGRSGHIERDAETFSPADFGGAVPVVGDRILKVGATPQYRGEKIDFSDPRRRTFWVVKERIFRTDMPACLLVCDEQQATDREVNLI